MSQSYMRSYGSSFPCIEQYMVRRCYSDRKEKLTDGNFQTADSIGVAVSRRLPLLPNTETTLVNSCWLPNSLSYILFFFFFFPFQVALMAYGSSQARGPIRAVAAGLRHTTATAHGTQTMSANYTPAHGNMGFLTHWVRSGIEPASSWILVGLITHWATMGTPFFSLLLYYWFQQRICWKTNVIKVGCIQEFPSWCSG